MLDRAWQVRDEDVCRSISIVCKWWIRGLECDSPFNPCSYMPTSFELDRLD